MATQPIGSRRSARAAPTGCASARYAVGVPRGALAPHGGESFVAESVARVLGAESLPIIRNIDGIGKKVDVRRYLREIVVGDDRAARALGEAGLVGDLLPMLVDIAVTGSGSTKISEVLSVLFADAVPAKAVRVALGLQTAAGLASPLDLPAVAASASVSVSVPDSASDSVSASVPDS
jgi:hypothetical protein